MKYSIFITLEPYLLQWLQNECGANNPLQIARSSVEAAFLEVHLRTRPRDVMPQLKPMGNQVEVLLPCFRSINIRCRNYLPESDCVALKKLIRNRFLVQLWKEVHRIDGEPRLDLRLKRFMKRNGITDDDTNYHTIHKIYDRLVKVYKK